MPDERINRRIPVHSTWGHDEETTEKPRLLFYLRQVERQAEIYNACLPQAVTAALRPGGVTDAFRHIQSAMFAAIVMNPLLSYNDNPGYKGWPGEKAEAKQAALDALQWRASKLRQLLGLSDISEDEVLLFQVREVRNSLEHVDERIDLALHSEDVASLADWYISVGLFIVSLSGPTGR